MKMTKEIAQCQAALSHVQAQMCALQGDMTSMKTMARDTLTAVTQIQGTKKDIPTSNDTII